MAAQKKQLSLDANIVFDLAEDKDFAHDFREIFQSKGYALVLPPTAAHELHVIFTHGESKAERELARTALTKSLNQASLRSSFHGTLCALSFTRAKIRNFSELLHKAKQAVGLLPTDGEFGKYFT